MNIKTNISVTLDSEVIGRLAKIKNKSDFINSILRRVLLTREGVEEQIVQQKVLIKELEARREEIQKREDEVIVNVSERVRGELEKARDAIRRNPSKLELKEIWLEIINSNCKTAYTSEQFERLLKEVK